MAKLKIGNAFEEVTCELHGPFTICCGKNHREFIAA